MNNLSPFDSLLLSFVNLVLVSISITLTVLNERRRASLLKKHGRNASNPKDNKRAKRFPGMSIPGRLLIISCFILSVLILVLLSRYFFGDFAATFSLLPWCLTQIVIFKRLRSWKGMCKPENIPPEDEEFPPDATPKEDLP
jgi:hypothetical protein